MQTAKTGANQFMLFKANFIDYCTPNLNFVLARFTSLQQQIVEERWCYLLLPLPIVSDYTRVTGSFIVTNLPVLDMEVDLSKGHHQLRIYGSLIYQGNPQIDPVPDWSLLEKFYEEYLNYNAYGI